MTESTGSRKMMPDELDRVVRDLTSIGRTWAVHGLNVGKSALETSATTLRTTADVIGRISSRLSVTEKGEATCCAGSDTGAQEGSTEQASS